MRTGVRQCAGLLLYFAGKKMKKELIFIDEDPTSINFSGTLPIYISQKEIFL